MKCDISNWLNVPLNSWLVFVSLDIVGTTAWFEAYRDSFLSVLPPLDHEYFKHFIACILDAIP